MRKILYKLPLHRDKPTKYGVMHDNMCEMEVLKAERKIKELIKKTIAKCTTIDEAIERVDKL